MCQGIKASLFNYNSFLQRHGRRLPSCLLY
nr:MAG TPA: hypothetical protein [Caudoviricetes sp.]